MYVGSVHLGKTFDLVRSLLVESQHVVKEPDSPQKQKLKTANSRLRTKVGRLAKKASQKKSTTIAAISQFFSGTALELLKTQIMLAG